MGLEGLGDQIEGHGRDHHVHPTHSQQAKHLGGGGGGEGLRREGGEGPGSQVDGQAEQTFYYMI
jgi:hypothetical protein